MMAQRSEILDAFTKLGEKMTGSVGQAGLHAAIVSACRSNPWFTPAEVSMSIKAIASEMLDSGKLRVWAGNYQWAAGSKNILLIMAGNIPLAGFFDMLCILVAGHRCIVKYSSKDAVMMEYVVEELKNIYPHIPISGTTDSVIPDAVIASGSDNAMRHLRSAYGNIPALLRGNRASCAILNGSEGEEELNALANDVFMYSGLGCRNVSHLLVPDGYDTARLADALSNYPACNVNPKYINNFRQRKAVLELSGEPFRRGSFFILRESPGFPSAISEITYSYYNDSGHALQWIKAHEPEIQCIVSDDQWNNILPFPAVPFGRAQSPSLYDFPDRKDTMVFLSGL